MPSFLLTAGPYANAVCLTFANGTKRYVAFSSDPMGATDSLLGYGTNHPLVTYGETASLLQRDAQNRVTEYGYVVHDFANGTTVKAERPKYIKQTKTYVCP